MPKGRKKERVIRKIAPKEQNICRNRIIGDENRPRNGKEQSVDQFSDEINKTIKNENIFCRQFQLTDIDKQNINAEHKKYN